MSFFDIIFIVDGILNLFIGFYDKDGVYEPKLVVVIIKNYSNGLLFELIYYLLPIYIGIEDIDTLLFFCLKIPRYARLMDMN